MRLCVGEKARRRWSRLPGRADEPKPASVPPPPFPPLYTATAHLHYGPGQSMLHSARPCPPSAVARSLHVVVEVGSRGGRGWLARHRSGRSTARRRVSALLPRASLAHVAALGGGRVTRCRPLARPRLPHLHAQPRPEPRCGHSLTAPTRSQDLAFTDKVVIVTGAGGGLGRACSSSLLSSSSLLAVGQFCRTQGPRLTRSTSLQTRSSSPRAAPRSSSTTSRARTPTRWSPRSRRPARATPSPTTTRRPRATRSSSRSSTSGDAST